MPHHVTAACGSSLALSTDHRRSLSEACDAQITVQVVCLPYALLNSTVKSCWSVESALTSFVTAQSETAGSGQGASGASHTALLMTSDCQSAIVAKHLVPPSPPRPPGKPPTPPPSPPPSNNPSSTSVTAVAGARAGARQDPHLAFAHGGHADFRGRSGAYYAFFSAPRLALNVKMENASFRLNGGRLAVHGTFVTEAHMVAVVGGAKGKLATVSFWAEALNDFNTGYGFVNGTCGYFGSFNVQVAHTRRCEEMSIKVRYSSAVFQVRAWAATVRGGYVYDRISGPRHRLDVSISAPGNAPERTFPHGLLGQSFASSVPRNGKQDSYPAAGRFATSAQAEGAIEGTAAMYEVESRYATRFAFSRFDIAMPTTQLQNDVEAARNVLPTNTR